MLESLVKNESLLNLDLPISVCVWIILKETKLNTPKKKKFHKKHRGS